MAFLVPQLLWSCNWPSFKIELEEFQEQKPHKTGWYQEGGDLHSSEIRTPAAQCALGTQSRAASRLMPWPCKGTLGTEHPTAIAVCFCLQVSASYTAGPTAMGGANLVKHRANPDKELILLEAWKKLKYWSTMNSIYPQYSRWDLQPGNFSALWFCVTSRMCIFDTGIVKLREGDGRKKKKGRSK